MRCAVVGVMVVVITHGAHLARADGKLAELATGYDKELASCRVHEAGLAKVIAGAHELAPDDAVATDLARLDAAHAIVINYCGELDATLALLRADPHATYKSLEHQLDDHDNKIRALRKTSKQVLDDVAPIIERLIPRINARAGTADHTAPKTPTAFPSGRTVALPPWPGTWRVSGTKSKDVAEYTERDAALSLSARAFTGATCDQQAKAQGEPAGAAWERTPAPAGARRDAWSLPLLHDAAWKLAYAHAGRYVQVECIAGKAGGAIVTLDEPDAPRVDRDASELAAAMASELLAHP